MTFEGGASLASLDNFEELCQDFIKEVSIEGGDEINDPVLFVLFPFPFYFVLTFDY